MAPVPFRARFPFRVRFARAGTSSAAAFVVTILLASCQSSPDAAPAPASSPRSTPATSHGRPSGSPAGATASAIRTTRATPVTPSSSTSAPSPRVASPPARHTVLRGTGQFHTVAVDRPALGPGRRVRYAVQVEGGIPVNLIGFAAAIHATLVDPRGWQGVDHVAFVEVANPTKADIVVTLATPATTDRLCLPLDTGGWLDCWNGSRAVINSDRWLYGAKSYGTDLAAYRNEVVNHEVGHGLGHLHRFCPGPGRPAPVMQQQTISLQGCRANPWPSVTGG